jgi:hypothetical protein
MIKALGCLALSLAACGLINSDVTQFKVRFPAKDFTVDASAFGLKGGGVVPAVPCSVNCTARAADLCSGACTASCEDATSLCQAHVPVTVKNDYDLSTEAPDYAQFASQNIVSVSVDSIVFNITQNTLNVDTPTLTVSLQPQTGGGAAEIVGTIPAVRAGQTGSVAVVFGAGGQATLKKFMDNFKTRFSVLVTGDVVVKGGQAAPTGKLVGQVVAEGHVGL